MTMLHVTLSFLTQTQALSDLMMKYDSGSQKTAEAKYSISLKTFVIGSVDWDGHQCVWVTGMML